MKKKWISYLLCVCSFFALRRFQNATWSLASQSKDCANRNFQRRVFPLRPASSVWPQSPRPNHYSLLTQKESLENQNWMKYKSNFWWKKSNKKCSSNWLYYLKYANVFCFMQECEFHYVRKLWFSFQMPCLNSSVLQYFTECRIGQSIYKIYIGEAHTFLLHFLLSMVVILWSRPQQDAVLNLQISPWASFE